MAFTLSAALGALGALGGIGGGLLSSVSSARSAKRAYKYSLALQNHQYDLNQRSLRESPSASREGYVNAGYNPLLALGSNGMGFNSGANMSPTENNLAGDVSNGINSAIAMKQADASINNVNANSALQAEQAETERAKRVQMDFQNSMLDVQKHIADEDLATYKKRFYMDMYERMQRAENYRANSAVAQMNAETNRMNYQVNSANAATNKYNAETNRYKSDKRFGFGIGFNDYTPPEYRSGSQYRSRSNVRTDRMSEHGYW